MATKFFTLRITGIFLLIYFGTSDIIFAAGNTFKRYIFLTSSLDDQAEIERVENLVKSGKTLGFNGVVLTSKFDILDLQSANYIERLKRIKSICSTHEFDLVPCIFSIGYADSLLAHDKNLAAGYPVYGMLFKAEGLVTHPHKYSYGSDNEEFTCGFEDFKENVLSGFLFQDEPGKISFIDKDVYRSGRSSLRLENFRSNQHGNARLCLEIKTKTFSSLELSFWYKSDNLSENIPVKAQAYTIDGRCLSWREQLQPTNTWQRAALEFNTLEHERLRLYIGVWGGKGGRIWIDDLKVSRQNDLSGLIRRAGAPFTVKNASTSELYTEGEDYRIGKVSPSSEFFEIKIVQGGQIHDGDILSVSFYRKYVLGQGQVSACMAAPEVYKIWERQIDLINQIIKPNAYFLSMDEIRQGGYCGLCEKIDLSKLLGHCVTKQFEIIKKYNSGADVYMWSDMIDPNVNAVKGYYMTRDGFENSWKYVPNQIFPVIWERSKKDQSISHFGKNGFKVLISIDVDSTETNNILQGWKKSFQKIKDAKGIMYTTWRNDYSHIEEFSRVFFE